MTPCHPPGERRLLFLPSRARSRVRFSRDPPWPGSREVQAGLPTPGPGMTVKIQTLCLMLRLPGW